MLALLAVLAGSSMADAQLERLPPITQERAVTEYDPRWSAERLAWSNKIMRGNAGLDAISPHNEFDDTHHEAWTWHVLPPGLVYRSYLAAPKESRFASYWNYDQNLGSVWDITLGGRVSMLRYGNTDPLLPRGFEIQIEGAAFPRLNPNYNMDLDACDFRFGIPLAYSHGPWEHKLAFYHLSSHLGDELMIREPWIERINYSRDAIVLGLAYRWTPDLRLYAEAAWSFKADGGAEPWEFQFGADYSPIIPTGFKPMPFFALNGYLRQELNFGGNFVAQTGLQWRSAFNGGRFRMGVEYYNGGSRQFEFYYQFEQQIGGGLWYDF